MHEVLTSTTKSSPTPHKFLPLQTTPELYTTLTEVFVDKPLIYNPLEGMVFDPPTSPEYTSHLQALKASGRTINTTSADGNFMFRSLSKGLLGTEKYHYRIRTTLFGFIYMGTPKSFCPTLNKSIVVQSKSGSIAYPWIKVAFGAQKLSFWPLLPCYKHLCTHTHSWEPQDHMGG